MYIHVLGGVCIMLRNNQHFKQPIICWQDCFKEATHKTESKRKDDTRNSNSSISQS